MDSSPTQYKELAQQYHKLQYTDEVGGPTQQNFVPPNQAGSSQLEGGQESQKANGLEIDQAQDNQIESESYSEEQEKESKMPTQLKQTTLLLKQGNSKTSQQSMRINTDELMEEVYVETKNKKRVKKSNRKDQELTEGDLGPQKAISMHDIKEYLDNQIKEQMSKSQTFIPSDSLNDQTRIFLLDIQNDLSQNISLQTQIVEKIQSFVGQNHTQAEPISQPILKKEKKLKRLSRVSNAEQQNDVQRRVNGTTSDLRCPLTLAEKKEYIGQAHSGEFQRFKQFSEEQLLHVISNDTLDQQNGMIGRMRQLHLMSNEIFSDFPGKLSVTTLRSIYKFFKIYDSE